MHRLVTLAAAEAVCLPGLRSMYNEQVLNAIWAARNNHCVLPPSSKANIDGERRVICFYREQKKNLSPNTGVETVSLLLLSALRLRRPARSFFEER
jgi:hypothetical protein